VKSLLFKKQSQQQASRLLFLFENLNKVLGYLRNLVVSWVIGFGVLSDLYFLVFGLASSVSTIITGAIGATFIPYSQQLGFSARRKLLGGSAVAVSGLFFLIVVPAVFFVIANASAPLQSEAFSTNGLLIIQGVVLGFAAIQLLQLTDEFNRSRRNFLLGGCVLLAVNIVAVVLLRCGVPFSPAILGWASAIPALVAVGWIFVWLRLPLWDWKSALPYLRQTAPLMLSGSIGMLNVFIDRWFAAGFESGRLSIMQTALMLVTQIGGALASPMINSAYPYFSAAFVNHQWNEAYAAVARVEDRVLLVIYGFAGAFVLLGKWGLSIIYDHGAVQSHNIDALYLTGCMYLPVFIYGSLVTLYLRVLYCKGEIRLPATLSVVIIVLNVLLNLLLVGRWGWQALVASASICSWLYFLALALAIHVKKHYPLRLSRFVLMNLPALAALFWGLGS
jgi:putative peptidoglycan lipid II flippase